MADQLVPNGSLDAYQADRTAVLVVGLGTTAGYLAQFLAQLPALFRADIPLRPRWDPRHPALLTIARLSAWTIGAVVANQVSFILISVLANTNGGNLSSFMYAYTFMQLPYAIIAVSIAYAVAPDLAELWTDGNTAVFARTLSRAMRVTLALLLPAGVGYALLARPAALLALAHGHLSASSAEFTGSVLTVFALGLPGFSAYLLLMRAFQSKQDTRSMFWLYAGENALTVVAARCCTRWPGSRAWRRPGSARTPSRFPSRGAGYAGAPLSPGHLLGWAVFWWRRASWPASSTGYCKLSPNGNRLRGQRRALWWCPWRVAPCSWARPEL